MAKKKKHRKSNRSRKQRLQASSAGVQTTTQQASKPDISEVKKKLTSATPTNAKPSKDQLIYDDVELSYVKEDVTKTLVLVGLILAVYAGIWFLMSYTSFGNQLLRVFSR